MVFDIDCMYAFEVLDCWEAVRQTPSYEDKFGQLVFQKYVFYAWFHTLSNAQSN